MKYLAITIYTVFVFSFFSCTSSIDKYTELEEYAQIHPEYVGTYIPYNIAPLNFQIREKADEFQVHIVGYSDSIQLATKQNLNIPLKKWKNLLADNKDGKVTFKIFAKKEGVWIKYKDVDFNISSDPIDPYIAYRLIEPGYAGWGKMGLYQRSLDDFEETPIAENSQTGGNCMNCHSFDKYNPNRMLFHMRGDNAGTVFFLDGKLKKIDTKASWTMSAGVYPRWHPSGKYVAFSVNATSQGFLTAHTNKIEVFDMASDIVLYDVEKNRLDTTHIVFSPNSYETFPEWSPDGKYLYFCSADALQMPESYESIKYSLLRVEFDEETHKFSNIVDTLVSVAKTGKSVSMPRVSPDGQSLVFCMFDYGTFPIWHRENDLYLLDLNTREYSNMEEVNSNETDSYHSWSSNGRWLLFSSRRMDGQYTRLYISYFDKDGVAHKPILLPQQSPNYYDYLLKSYNVPEFISGKVEVSLDELSKVVENPAIKLVED